MREGAGNVDDRLAVDIASSSLIPHPSRSGQQGSTGIAVAGGLGMVLDSLLGATLQGKTRWLDNDAVNLLATLAGAALATAGVALHG